MSNPTHNGICASCGAEVSNDSFACLACNAVWIEKRTIMERVFYLIPAFVAGFLAVVVFMGTWSLLGLNESEYSGWFGNSSIVVYFIVFIYAFVRFDVKRSKKGHWDKS